MQMPALLMQIFSLSLSVVDGRKASAPAGGYQILCRCWGISSSAYLTKCRIPLFVR